MRIRWANALLLACGLTAAAPLPKPHSSLRPYSALMLPASPPKQGELRVRFMGVSTLLFDDGDKAILVDGFFSRPKLDKLVPKPLESNRERIDQALTLAEISRLDAVIVAHSHYDHAMDSAAIADRFGARLIGSPSTANIGLGAGLTEKDIRRVKGGDSFALGRFRITVIESRHGSPNVAPGDILAPLNPRSHAYAYKEGGSLSFLVEHQGLRMLIHATAGFRPNDMKDVKDVDVVFLGLGGLGLHRQAFIDAYWQELVGRTGAKVVIPIHWDNFLRSLKRPLQPMPDFARSMQAVICRAGKERAVRLMPTFEPVDIAAALQAPKPTADCRG
jgi:L-ascorbate metabolism protein UlaG (beta-lactamase superfamily)